MLCLDVVIMTEQRRSARVVTSIYRPSPSPTCVAPKPYQLRRLPSPSIIDPPTDLHPTCARPRITQARKRRWGADVRESENAPMSTAEPAAL